MTDDMNGYQWLRAYALEPEPCEKVKVRSNQWAASTSFHSEEIYHGRALSLLCCSKKEELLWTLSAFSGIRYIFVSVLYMSWLQVPWSFTALSWGGWYRYPLATHEKTEDFDLFMVATGSGGRPTIHIWTVEALLTPVQYTATLTVPALWYTGKRRLWKAMGSRNSTAKRNRDTAVLTHRLFNPKMPELLQSKAFLMISLWSGQGQNVSPYIFVDGKCEMQSEVAHLGLQSKPAAGGIDGRSGS